MAEYIDREQLLELINEDCKYQNPTNEYTRGCNEVCDWAIKTIKNIPTADVVPKSEVDMSQHLLKDAWKRIEELDELCGELQKSKTEVAREIFEEIDEIMANIEIYVSDRERTNFEIGAYKCHASISLKIAELKKKYM